MSWLCGGCGMWKAPHVMECGCRMSGPVSAAQAEVLGSGSSTTPTPRTPRRKQNTYTPAFEEFWEVYPSNRDKYAASRAYAAAVRDGAEPHVLLQAAAAYAADPKRDPDRTKYAQGWLNDRRWEDVLVPVKPPSHEIGNGVLVGSPEWDAAREAEERRAMEA